MTPVGGRRRLPVRLRSIVVMHEGERWERDLMKCRVVLTMRRMEGKFSDVEELAGKIGLNSDTVHRWLRGVGPGTDQTTARILAGLELEFNDVHRKADEPAEGDGPVMPSR